MPTAFVLIKCQEGGEHKIADYFDSSKVKMDIQPTVGHYDLVAKVESSETDQLNEIIGKIRGSDKVSSTQVLLEIPETS